MCLAKPARLYIVQAPVWLQTTVDGISEQYVCELAAVATLTVFHTAHCKLLFGSHLSGLRQKYRGPATDCHADLAEAGDFLPWWQRRVIADWCN